MFTVEDLARCAYPGKVIEDKHLTAVRRALDGIPGPRTDGPRSNQHLKGHPTGRGWHRVVRVVALKCCTLCKYPQIRCSGARPWALVRAEVTGVEVPARR